MCGLVGVITKNLNGFTQAEVDSFEQMLYADKVRGSDGTGIFYNTKKSKPLVKTLKAPYGSSIFIETKEFHRAKETLYQQSNFAIGHNRAATKGEKTVENTHPFREKHIVLVHNGTIPNHKNLHDTLASDSHSICHSFAEIGAKETLKKIDGAFALIWFDSQERSLNLCRNYQRPLYIIECSSCHLVVSELELGLWIAKRNKMPVVKHTEVKTETLYSFYLEDMKVFHEEALEYKSYYQAPTTSVVADTPWKGQHTSGESWREQQRHKYYPFGAEIRFRTSVIRRGEGNYPYMEGDINMFPKMLKANVQNSDFEDRWRVRIVGMTEKEMLPLVSRECTGKINKTAWMGGTGTYYVSDVKEYKEEEETVVEQSTSFPALTDKLKDKDDNSAYWCECCNLLQKGKPIYNNGINYCPSCAAILDKEDEDLHDVFAFN